MSSQLGNKRRFLDGRDDWRFQTEKAPVTTSADQFIQGQKVFNDPVLFYQDIKCLSSYRGDGSQLTGIIPSIGGIMTGQLTVPSIKFSNQTIQTTAYKALIPATYTNANIVVNSFGQIDAIYNGSGGGGGGGVATSADLFPSPEDNFPYYPIFASSAGSAKTLYVDATADMLRYIPLSGTLQCPTFSGALTGNADSASTILVQAPTVGSPNHHVLFTDGTTSNQSVHAENGLNYNSSTNTLTTTNFQGSLIGNADSATLATNATNANTAAVATQLTVTEHVSGGSTHNLLFAGSSPVAGNKDVQVKSNLQYNTTTETLSAPIFSGALTGNVTGNVSGSSTSCTGNAASASQISVTATDTGTTNRILFSSGSGGNQTVYNDTNLRYDAISNEIVATTFRGALYGTAKYAQVVEESSATLQKLVMHNTSGLSFNLSTDFAATIGESLCYDSLNNILYAPSISVSTSVLGSAFNSFVRTSGSTFTGQITGATTASGDNNLFLSNSVSNKAFLIQNAAVGNGSWNNTSKAGDVVLVTKGATNTTSHAANYTLWGDTTTAPVASNVGLRLQSTSGVNATATLTGGKNVISLNSQLDFSYIKSFGINLGVDSTDPTPLYNNNIYVGSGNSGTYASQQLFIGQIMDTTKGKSYSNASAFNIAIGSAAGQNFNGTSSQDCIAIGRKALGQIGATLGGSNNIGIGTNTGYSLNAVTGTNGSYNIMMGTNSGSRVTTGDYNTLIGNEAGNNITTQTGNVCIGNLAGARLTSATGNGHNVFIGNNAGYSASAALTGAHNVSIGYESLSAITGNSNGHIAIGYQAGKGISTTTVNGSVVIGYQSGMGVTTNQQLIIGSATAPNYTGTNSIIIGHASATNLTTGGSNLILGNASGNGNLGANNTIIGNNSGDLSTAAFGSCTIVGVQSGRGNLGVQNTLFGNGVGNAITGASNSVFGRGAATALTTGIGNIVIGCNNAVDLVGGSYNVLIASGTGGTNNSTGTVNDTDDIRIGRQNKSKFHIQGNIYHNVRILTLPTAANSSTSLPDVEVTSFPDLYSIYAYTITVNTSCYIPNPSAVYEGRSIRFRKRQSGAFTLTIETVNDFTFFPLNPTTSTGVSTVVIGTTQANMELVCIQSSTPTLYHWHVIHLQ